MLCTGKRKLAFMEFELDQETLTEALKQIHFYKYLPKHIKGKVSEFKTAKLDTSDSAVNSICTADRSTTIRNGALNVPDVTSFN